MRIRFARLTGPLCVAALVLISVMLAACAAPTQEGAAPAEAGQTEISVWSFEPPGAPWVDAYISKFQEQHPDIKINYTPFPEDEYQTKVATALAAHNPPDVAVIENKGWMKSGKVVDLTDQLQLWGVESG